MHSINNSNNINLGTSNGNNVFTSRRSASSNLNDILGNGYGQHQQQQHQHQQLQQQQQAHAHQQYSQQHGQPGGGVQHHQQYYLNNNNNSNNGNNLNNNTKTAFTSLNNISNATANLNTLNHILDNYVHLTTPINKSDLSVKGLASSFGNGYNVSTPNVTGSTLPNANSIGAGINLNSNGNTFSNNDMSSVSTSSIGKDTAADVANKNKRLTATTYIHQPSLIYTHNNQQPLVYNSPSAASTNSPSSTAHYQSNPKLRKPSPVTHHLIDDHPHHHHHHPNHPTLNFNNFHNQPHSNNGGLNNQAETQPLANNQFVNYFTKPAAVGNTNQTKVQPKYTSVAGNLLNANTNITQSNLISNLSFPAATSTTQQQTPLNGPLAGNVHIKKSNSLKAPVRAQQQQILHIPQPQLQPQPQQPTPNNNTPSTPTPTSTTNALLNANGTQSSQNLKTPSPPPSTASTTSTSSSSSTSSTPTIIAANNIRQQPLPANKKLDQRIKATISPSVPLLSVTTANGTSTPAPQATQNFRQSTTAISPIQLQNLSNSPSLSDFRIRSKSSNVKTNNNHSIANHVNNINGNKHKTSTTNNNNNNHNHNHNHNHSVNNNHNSNSTAGLIANTYNNNNPNSNINNNHINNNNNINNSSSISSSCSSGNSNTLKQTLQNIELKMRIIASPNIRIADLFKCFLKNVPKSTETIESLVHYGDNIGAKIVKCLINENLYESQSLINQDYDIYQGPALCVTYDAILREEHWDEIFICNDEEFPYANGTTPNSTKSPPNATNGKSSKSSSSQKSSNAGQQKNGNSSPSQDSSTSTGASSPATASQSAQQASKFISFFHISDFIAILSGYKVAFVDPYERFAPDERSYVAIFDLEHDTHDIEQFEDQFKPLEKIFNVPLLKNRYYNGTIIRLPLRTQTSTCSVSNKLVHVKDILVNAKDFMKEAHLHILFAKHISNIQFCRTKDNQNIEKIYSINVEDSCMDQFRQKYKKISDAISDGEFPRTSTIIITLRKQIETKIEKTEWILSIFADTMRLLNSNYFLMKLAIPISDNCDKDIRFSHKSNLISSDTGFIKTLYLTKPIICYIEDKEGILMSHFCRLNISDSLKLSHFNDAYALMLKDLTKIIRKDPALLWSLMPDLEKNSEFSELLGEIWTEIGKHELFYSCTEGWGYVAIEDMIINDVEDRSVLQEILTKVYSETNYPVVIMPHHVLKALQKFSPKESLQIMTPSQTSDILHNNVALIEQLKPNQKIELLRYLIKEPANSASTSATQTPATSSSHLSHSSSSSSLAPWPTSAARYVLDLPLLLLASQKFIRFQPINKVKPVYYVEREYMSLFNTDTAQMSQFINPELPKDILQVLKKFEFQRLTQVQMISDSELSELLNVPKEWRNGDEKIYWPKAHEKYNVEWLETLWKYLGEYSKDDLTMMENLNIIYTNANNTKANGKAGPRRDSPPNLAAASPPTAVSPNAGTLVLYKLSKNSNLVYTPGYTTPADGVNGTTNDATSISNNKNGNSLNDPSTSTTPPSSSSSSSSNIDEETYVSLVRILNKLGFQCIESLSQTVLNHALFLNYVPNLRKSRFDLLRAFRNKYKHASSVKITQDFNALLNETDIKILQLYLSKVEIHPHSHSHHNHNHHNHHHNHNHHKHNNHHNHSNSNNHQPTSKSKELDEELELIDILKQLPIFENSAIECSDKYLPLKEASLIYDTPVRLPFELVGIRPFIYVDENECKLLITEKLGLNLVKDFSTVIKEIIKYATSRELNSLPSSKIHSLGRWLLLNCASYLLATSSPKTPNDLVELIKHAKLFLNQKQELCAPVQFINPLYKEKFLDILDPKHLPAKDLLTEAKCVNLLKELKMRNCLQLKVDEIIDLYEHSIKQNDNYRRLLAELIIDILMSRVQECHGADNVAAAIDKALNEYSTAKAVTLRHFLMSVNWIPLQRERPQSYPQSLFWKGAESTTTGAGASASQTSISSSTGGVRFSSPRDCVDSHYAYCAGSVACVGDLEIPSELKTYIDLKQVHLDLVVRHLKLTTKCFESSALKVEWYDYLTVAKRCYEFMSTCEPQDIYRELKANDLNEWIWNGAGFSSINTVFIITEKDHPLCAHVAVLPYELYVFVKFFERLGIKKQPDSKQLEHILVKCVKSFQKLITPGTKPSSNEQTQAVLENAAKNYPLINWIKTFYSNEKKLISIVKDYEESLTSVGASLPAASPTTGAFLNGGTKTNGVDPTPTGMTNTSPLIDDTAASGDSVFVYLPELYKSVEIRDNLINAVMTLIKNKQIKILDEEAYLMRKVAAAATAAQSQAQSATTNGNGSAKSPQTNNIFDHYRVYNEIILPNLNSLSKNVKDAVVLFALDHADPKMLEILRDHPCIPVTPFGRKLKKPNKLVHPGGKIAPLYADADERFPCGSEDTYTREDRLQILKILGMKCDYLNWHELVERADSVAKIREYDLAVERSIAILNVLNEMLTNSTPPPQAQPNGTQATKQVNGQTPTESKDEKEARCRACELIRDIAFVPVKTRPYQKIGLTWYGDKYKYKFAKPKELLANSYENLCSTLWPVPLHEYRKKENIITKQVEQFLGIDELNTKFSLSDALKQLEEVSKVNLAELDDSKEVKLINEMCFQLYEYIQAECQKKPTDYVHLVREFFNERRCILINEELVAVNQLCWHLNVNLKPMFYQLPTAYLRSYKFLFNQVLNVRVNLELSDLLHVIDTIKRKYRDMPVAHKDDFNMLINVYSLMIDQGYQIITNLYLPNIQGVLLPGKLLFMNPINPELIDKPDDYVHPAVDRRICTIAGCNINKRLVGGGGDSASSSATLLTIQNHQTAATPTTTNGLSPNSNPSGRMFPRVFGNKRLEGILARLDDDKIDLNLLNNIDEGNPQIILEYLLEANRVHSLSAFLSEDDVFVILKYFNDFLARNYQAGTFHRLKELKIYKPIWSEKHISVNFNSSGSFGPSMTSLTTPLNTNSLVSNVCLISEEMASLMKRSFKQSPFQPTTGLASSSSTSLQSVSSSTSSLSSIGSTPTTGLIVLVRRPELTKLYTHLNLLCLNDLEAFLNLCLPQFRKLDAKSQNNILKYLYEEILEKSYIHEREKCFKILRDKLYLQTRKADHQLISDLYDTKSETLKNILSDGYFPDESFDSPQCLRFLKEAGLRTYLPSELCKKCMNEIETRVTDGVGWTDELRARSKWLYQHLIENWQRFDDSVLQQRFLEPYCVDARYVSLRQPFEYAEFSRTCLKLSDAELQKYEHLVWSSSYLLPAFVTVDSIDANAAEFLKLNRKPCFALVNQHLTNICESINSKAYNLTNTDPDAADQLAGSANNESLLVECLSKIYQYLDDLSVNEHQKDVCKQLEDKDIVWSSSTRKFVSPGKVCIQLEASDEIAPFVFSLTPSLRQFKSLFVRLGAKDKPYPMLYGDILRKMARVCGDDYLNSNELCKALRAMEYFFKYLKVSSDVQGGEGINSQHKLPGLYFVTTELKLEKSSSVVILDNRENLDDLAKLPHEKFVFNPGERAFKMNTGEIKPLIDKIFISQRPTLFSQKYEATYDFTLPDDPDSQRQNLLTSLERKYQQIFTSRQLHRCLARCIANEEARRSSPKHLPIDEVEKVIRERLSSIKVTCVEYLETSLSYRKLSNQQKLEQTVEEKACYLTHESAQFATLYVSKKHIEQPYFALCIARALQPLLMDLHFDYSIFTSLIATSVSQMSKLLQLANVATEENILSVIKLQYVPSSGKLYGDDVNLLAAYDPKLHNVLIGDLCVFCNAEGAYIYCQIMKIYTKSRPSSSHHHRDRYTSTYQTANGTSTELDYEFLVQVDDAKTLKIGQKELYVLENWHRIYDAVIAKPPDERESFKYSENQYGSNGNGTSNGGSTPKQNGAGDEGKRSPGDGGEENFSSNGSDSDRSDTSSTYGSNEHLPSSIEVEQAKGEVNNELRLLWGLEENERKKKINRLLLKWHPDKNPGKEKFASEVFKHLKKQIELYKTDPFLASYYRSTYSSYTSGFNSSSTAGAGSTYGTGSSTAGSRADDYKSRHYGSFEDLHRKGSPGSGSPHSSPSRDGAGHGSAYDYDSTKGPGHSNLGRAGSFRQEWERRRQQKRQTAGSDPRDRSSPSSARRRGTDFTQMDASLWFTQAKGDLDSANNDMHPITGKPAYEWVCYKCYRAVEKALRSYHYFKGNGKLPASDIHGLLLGVEPSIRDIAFRFCNFIGNEANSMQYPGIARFGKTPNEVFTLTKAEQALDYGKELLKLVEEVIYAN